jgi:O-antigen/teichoic acid export membrane protein
VDPRADRAGPDPEPQPRRSLPRDTTWFAAGTFAGKAVALVSLPLFARLLTPAEFGRLDVLNALISAGLATFMLGTDVAATRLYFDASSRTARRQLLSSWLALIALVAAPVAVLLIVGSTWISTALFGSPASALAVSLVGVVLFVGLLYAVALGVLRTLGRARAYGLLEGTALVVNAALGIALLVAWRQDAAAVMAALAICWGLAAMVGLAAVRRAASARPTRAQAVGLLRLGLPLAPAVAAALVGDFFNRSLLLGVSGADEAGYLSIAIRIASIAGLLVIAAQLAWQPHAYRLGTSAEALAGLAVEGRRIIVAVALIVVVLVEVVPEAIALVGGDRYAPAGPATCLALGAALANSLYVVTTLPSAMARATSDLAWSAIAGICASIALNVMLVASLGATGTAAAMLGGQIAAVAVAWARARRHPRATVWTRRLLVVVAAAMAVAIGSAIVWEPPIWARLALGIGMLIVLWVEGTLPVALRAATAQPTRDPEKRSDASRRD